jgi:hypothetical protein
MASRTLPSPTLPLSGAMRGAHGISASRSRCVARRLHGDGIHRLPAPHTRDELLRQGRERGRRPRPLRERRSARERAARDLHADAGGQQPANRPHRLRGAGVRASAAWEPGRRDQAHAALLRRVAPDLRPGDAVVARVSRRHGHRVGAAARAQGHRADGRRIGASHQRPAGRLLRRPPPHRRDQPLPDGGDPAPHPAALPERALARALHRASGNAGVRGGRCAEEERERRRAPGRHRGLPRWLMLLAAALFLGVATNEYVGRRLEWSGT